MIKLILIDVDGTLVGKNGVHAGTWEALERARARGVHLGLCTGRIGSGKALEYARRVSPDGFHIFQSGAVVSRPGRPAEYVSRLPAHAVPGLVAISRREGEPLEVYGETRFFLERHSELTHVHATHLDMEPEIVDLDELPEPAVRAQWVVSGEDWPRYRELTLALGGIEAHPASAPWSPGTVFSNLVCAGTSKATALRWLAERHGLATSEVAMVGDGENDLDALLAAGLGIVVGNAPAHVQASASVVVADVDAGGLAEAIAVALDS
jgi:Cof subfamily protein (haloacid dehalogenase superfamily)